ncbi:MAG: hypothetical protein IVW55_03940 [Chloroflexi bacterium]|nr:hypothetical protein [Chloroflexota bacterium]
MDTFQGAFTERDDWLTRLMAGQEGMLVSGHQTFSTRMDLLAQDVVAVRFMGNRARTYGYLLTVQAPVDEWGRVADTLQNSPNAEHVQGELRALLGTAPIAVFYDNGAPGKFGYLDARGYAPTDSEGLRDLFGMLDRRLVDRPGTIKAINRTINDSFQAWTRVHLSQYLIINDFDALLLGPEPIIFELKRVQEELNTWRPYLDDQANYAALVLIAANLRARLRVLAYRAEEVGRVAAHHIATVTQESITGMMAIFPADDAVGAGALHADTRYESHRRRA